MAMNWMKARHQTEVEHAFRLCRYSLVLVAGLSFFVNLLALSDEPVCVCELIDPLGLSQPTVSHHLKKLTAAGLLRREQRGVWAYYSIDTEALARVAALLDVEGAG